MQALAIHVGREEVVSECSRRLDVFRTCPHGRRAFIPLDLEFLARRPRGPPVISHNCNPAAEARDIVVPIAAGYRHSSGVVVSRLARQL